MLYAWDLNTLFSNPVTLICFSVFCVALFIAILILIFINIYKHIIQTFAKTIDLFDAIQKSPLKELIKRVSIISEDSGTLITEFSVWRTKFEILYEKQLIWAMQELATLLKDKKNSRPTIKNLKKINVLFKRATDINSTIHDILTQIISSIEIEFIQRDFITYQRELFTELKKEVTILELLGLDFDKLKLEGIISNIEEIFVEFFSNLEQGKYKESWNSLTKVDAALRFLIELLDSIPHIISVISTFIPEQLIDIKNKHVTFSNDRTKLSRNAEKFAILERNIDKLRLGVDTEIRKLQYKKAQRILNQAFDLINNFRDSVEHDDKLKDYFENNIDDIRTYFDNIDAAFRSIERAAKNMDFINNSTNQEKTSFEIARANYFRHKAKSDAIFSKIDLNISTNQDLDLASLKEELLVSLKEAVNDIDALDKVSRIFDKNATNTESLINQVIFVQTLLNQCEVKINQYKSIAELDRFITPIQELHNNLGKFTRESISKITSVDTSNQVAKQVGAYSDQAWNILRDLTDLIFLDYISQEIIIYLERYVGVIGQIEDLIVTCETLFQERKLENLIGYSIPILARIKATKKMKGV
ncbi:septation ring formation regulator EzrA [Spiroplasma culicicola]|uniref:Septation ring formation regulator n=1 Tax=Spiroplasma culicicola AES-1 TaxID=1276246 RepID=W6A8E5_9MOLU|nr:septation ring formation regulator EzrA [Spiroplasma culicicola]AHI53221.1 hypothetical protein SCULI_v1c08810 [Spiroplasma culicicola AES-1]